MHIPDGILSPPVWLSLDAAGIAATAWLARRLETAGNSSRLPLLGVMGAFVFAAQTVNIPVGFGASGHLLGSALLALVLGPASASLVLAGVLILQALLLQDGGVLALGANLCNMALAAVATGYLPARVWGRSPTTVFLGAVLSVLTSAGLTLWELSLSGVPLAGGPLGVATTIFALTAALEGAITVAAVRAIERIAPHALATHAPAAFPLRATLACASALLLCGIWFSSAAPDGLQYLTETIGFRGR